MGVRMQIKSSRGPHKTIAAISLARVRRPRADGSSGAAMPCDERLTALLPLVRLLARQAAREYLAQLTKNRGSKDVEEV